MKLQMFGFAIIAGHSGFRGWMFRVKGRRIEMGCFFCLAIFIQSTGWEPTETLGDGTFGWDIRRG